jgi:hypothetical protein
MEDTRCSRCKVVVVTARGEVPDKKRLAYALKVHVTSPMTNLDTLDVLCGACSFGLFEHLHPKLADDSEYLEMKARYSL